MVMRVPFECATPATCFMNAQAYLAQTSVGRELDGDDRIKIVCVQSSSISAARSVCALLSSAVVVASELRDR